VESGEGIERFPFLSLPPSSPDSGIRRRN